MKIAEMVINEPQEGTGVFVGGFAKPRSNYSGKAGPMSNNDPLTMPELFPNDEPKESVQNSEAEDNLDNALESPNAKALRESQETTRNSTTKKHGGTGGVPLVMPSLF